MAQLQLPELLAPAGNWDALRAAVANGADAVYFGVECFNARLRAENFQIKDLPELMAWLHRRGVKGFLTVNVLVFPSELPQAAELLLAAAAAGVDALICSGHRSCGAGPSVDPRAGPARLHPDVDHQCSRGGDGR